TVLTASSTRSKSLYLWDIETGQQLADLQGHTDVVTSVVFDPLNPYLAVSGGRDQSIKLWDLSKKELVARIFTESDVLSLDFSPDGQTIAAGFQRESGNTTAFIRLYQLGQLRSVGTLTATDDKAVIPDAPRLETSGHTDDVLTVAYSPDGQQLGSGGGATDGSIILWDVVTHVPVMNLEGHTSAVRSISFNASGSRLLSGSSDQTLRLWDIRSAEVIHDFIAHPGEGAVAVYGPHDRTILSGDDASTLRLWDIQSGLTMQELTGHTGVIMAVDLSSDGKRAISGSDDKTIIIWDVVNGTNLFTINAQSGTVTTLKFLPGDQQFVAAGDRGGLASWDVATGAQLQTFSRPTENELSVTARGINSLDVSKDGTLMVAGGNDTRVSVWDLKTGQMLRQIDGESSAIKAVAISPDGTMIAAGLQNGNVLLWTIDGEPIKTFKGHTRTIVGVQFSVDGKSVLSGALDASLRLWDIESGFEVRRYNLSEGKLLNPQSLEYGSNGDTILTGLSDSSVRLWRLLPTVKELLIWTFQNRYVPPLSCEQRTQFRLTGCDEAGNLPEETPFEVPPVTPDPPSLLKLAIGMEAVINSSNGDKIRMRQQPDTTNNENIVESLPDGSKITLLEGPIRANGFTWWRVQAEDGAEGFVAEVLPEEQLQLIIPADAFDQIAQTGY
ncbi:MAG TPA: WD40 repeat domain-containing protein, partial [Phototrophicaceae bacterium]|nr:WD40 repeat domain-containing protein [Phototrophicaceae bacterium]